MKTQFRYSTDFQDMNSADLSGFCLHLLCTAGEGVKAYSGALLRYGCRESAGYQRKAEKPADIEKRTAAGDLAGGSDGEKTGL